MPSVLELVVSNVGETVEAYDVEVLGDLAPFATVAPAEIRLLPGQQATATITVLAGTLLPVGATPFAVKARPQSGLSPAAVEERDLMVTAV